MREGSRHRPQVAWGREQPAAAEDLAGVVARPMAHVRLGLIPAAALTAEVMAEVRNALRASSIDELQRRGADDEVAMALVSIALRNSNRDRGAAMGC
jgi:hypothetical protein